jgi:trk system potassium uptake protein TrkH
VNLRLDARIVGLLVAALGATQLLLVLVALAFGDPLLPYLASGTICVASGLGLALPARPTERSIRPRDAFLVVGAGWVLASLAGAVLYLTTGILGPVDALFESVAGFTTTGSTVMADIEAAPRTLLLWRSFTQWLGGMGIILFTVAVLPLLGIGGMQLFRIEVPGPVKDKVRPRVIQAARSLWGIYVGLTLLEVLALILAGLSPFDAINHAFTTLATGGFSTRNASVGAYASPAVEWIVILFMTLAGVNFVLHFRLLSRGPVSVWRDAELRYYLFVLAVATLVVVAILPPDQAPSLEAALRNSLFSVVSITTTTGYGTVDIERWPALGQIVLLQLMILGGMSGSTGGGVKSLRVLIGFRALSAAIYKLVHPHAVRHVKYGGRVVPDDVIAGIWAFFTAYFALAALAAAVVAAAGYDLVTAASAALTALGNVGPGLGAIGPFDNFAHLPDMVKLVLALCMLAGRLEIFTFLVLLQPAFWRR